MYNIIHGFAPKNKLNKLKNHTCHIPPMERLFVLKTLSRIQRSQTLSRGEKESGPLTYNVLLSAPPGFGGEGMRNLRKKRHKHDNACAVPQS